MVSADVTTCGRNNWALSVGAMVQCWLLQCYPLGRATITNEEHPLEAHLAFVWMWYFIFLKSFLDVHGKSEGAVGPLAHSITSVLLWLCPGRPFSTKCNSISAAGCQELLPTVKGKILYCSSTAAVLGRTSFFPRVQHVLFNYLSCLDSWSVDWTVLWLKIAAFVSCTDAEFAWDGVMAVTLGL